MGTSRRHCARARVGIRDFVDYLAEDMTRVRKATGPKLLLLKVPDEELSKYRQELIGARLDFLL